jgi:hypothetical protein
MAFSACADLDAEIELTRVIDSCKAAGFSLVPVTEAPPSNVSVAGETSIFLRAPEADSSRPGGWWFWGAADNLRFPAWNGCKLAEWLEE